MPVRERRVVFEGASNFRDLGGYATSDGGVTRWGLVFRADGLHALTPQDIDRYQTLGVRTVYDLRRDTERAERQNRVRSVALCITSPLDAAGVEPLDRAGMSDHRSGELMLRTMYASLLAHSGTVFGRLFTDLADPEGVPAVFHCHAGKDRTGIVAALLLEVLGVEREVVLDDYELTARFRLREHQHDSFDNLVASGMAPEAAAGVLGAPRWAMADTLSDLDRLHGGAESYLTGPAGMDPGTIARLRARLVEY